MEKKTCFVIAPIGERGSNTRIRSDKIFKYVIKPVVEELGYEPPLRADHLAQPGEITNQIIQRINDDDLVIADLTDSNANVFYELAIRHMILKPFVQIIELGHKLPFDVASSRTIDIDHTDLDSVESAKEELARQIQAVEENPDQMDNPISVSLELRALKQSDDPIREILGDIQEKMGGLEGSVDKIEADLATMHNSSSSGIKDSLETISANVKSLTNFQRSIADLDTLPE